MLLQRRVFNGCRIISTVHGEPWPHSPTCRCAAGSTVTRSNLAPGVPSSFSLIAKLKPSIALSPVAVAVAVPLNVHSLKLQCTKQQKSEALPNFQAR